MASSLHHLASIAGSLGSARVLCVGDIMLDRYVYGSVDRVSPEAPVPVMAYQGEQGMLGGVGNVARNVAALGGCAKLVSMTGADNLADEVAGLCAEQVRVDANLIRDANRCTTVKTRFVAHGQQLLRADREEVVTPPESVQQELLDKCRSLLADVDAVLVADYAKGALSDSVLAGLIRAARAVDKPVIVDPKSATFDRYSGASVLKPNTAELRLATGFPCRDDASVEAAARAVLEQSDIGALVVTRSQDGMTLITRDDESVHCRAHRQEVFDVSGAGDTALAVLGLAVARGISLTDAMVLANYACSVAVGKIGTAAVYADELVRVLQSADLSAAGGKITHLQALLDQVSGWRSAGLSVGFTNGCFDLIHAGHVSLLEQAKSVCDKLVVAMNSDESVSRLKGEGRPVNNAAARAMVLASMGDVDAVIEFEDDTPLMLIQSLRPDVLIKGADYRAEEVVGAEFVQSYGGQLLLARLTPEVSTTRTINKMKS